MMKGMFSMNLSDSNRPNLSRPENILLISEAYPVPEDIYSGVFIHRRVLAYKKSGLNVDVFRYKKSLDGKFFSYDDVNVRCGHKKSLSDFLKSNQYDVILIHFLNEEIWDIVRQVTFPCRIICWVHGYEIQPWYRRIFNIQTQEQYESSVKISHERMRFWRGIFRNLPNNIHFVFISNHLKDTALSDIGVDVEKEKYSIIHNYIDNNIFIYKEKNPDERKRVLTIRSFSNPNYANDLTVNAILELSKRDFFSDLTFKIIGDGVLFDQVLKPLHQFSNVSIERKYLDGDDYVNALNGYGIMLIPTRLDSQGVTRGEAMATGMVPVTNAVSAIPEFVDKDSGMLAPAEDFITLADSIELLYNNPNLFKTISRKTAKRVVNQCGYNRTIKREIDLIMGLR